MDFVKKFTYITESPPLSQHEEALPFLNKSLTEQRAPEIAKLKQEVISSENIFDLLLNCFQTEKIIKEKKRLAYIDPALSTAAKERGNEFFKHQKYPEALKVSHCRELYCMLRVSNYVVLMF